ncbi:rhomboid family intramembrane serine protease [Aporhodopirellula aestuarii]|uniref:Rhomboid family intramembrane serine protease n=1 Tax=Aporhodopirellula aestuarii TaxID=2950107 RepID=A0ABT0UEH7_9BACT|nr:rhomboid family intramembrane serine protease [Aporhodopirellula aestuarii]MCM2375211.1 rhomboid family intramembrane serine protease [Aporhodopirellula aestuarii]
MRRIGNLPGEAQANRFCDYLQTQAIDAKTSSIDESAPPATTEHDIWIRDERDVEKARELFSQFQSDPTSSEYDVSAAAERLRRQRSNEIAKKLAAQKKSQMKLRRGTGGGNFAGGLGGQTPASIPVTIAVVVFATLIGFATNFSMIRPNPDSAEASSQATLYNALTCVDITTYYATGDAFASIKSGEVWRLFTPMLLHGSMMHLAFNMINLYILGGVVERIHGSRFYLFLLLLCQAVATTTQIALPDWLEGPLAIGASGAVFGVFGFVWIRPKFQPDYPVEIPSFNIKFMLGFLVLCFTPIIPGIANGAHVGGLVAGMLVAAVAPPRFG